MSLPVRVGVRTLSSVKRCACCGCLFFTDYDLGLHMKRFGSDAQKHLKTFRFAHRFAEKELSREHGGADRTVREIAKIIEEYAQSRSLKVR